MGCKHNHFFQGYMDRILFYWLNHSWETQLSKYEEDDEEEEMKQLVLIGAYREQLWRVNQVKKINEIVIVSKVVLSKVGHFAHEH